MLAPPIGLFADCVGEFDRAGVLAGADEPQIARQAQEQLHDLHALQELLQVRGFVSSAVGAIDEHDEIHALFGQPFAQRCLVGARHVGGHRRDDGE